MKKLSLLLSVIFLITALTIAQERRPLSHADYDRWETLSSQAISNDGQRVLYIIKPEMNDGNLFMSELISEQQAVVPRGAKAAFSPGNNFAVFHIEPPRAVVRKAKADKKKPDDMPQDSLGILIFNTGEIKKYASVISYQLPKDPSDWLAFTINFLRISEEKRDEAPLAPIDTIPAPTGEIVEDKKPAAPKKESIKQLIIFNPATSAMHTFDEVEQYRISENGRSVIFLQEPKIKGDTLKIKKLYVFNTQTQRLQLLDSVAGFFKQLSVSKNGELFAWLHSTDTTKVKVFDLLVHQSGRRASTQRITTSTATMPIGYAVSEFRLPSFSDDNSRLFFGIAPMPMNEPRDTLLDEEKYSLDVWHWQDPLLQSQQRVNLKRDLERTYETVFFIRNGKMVPLADEKMPDITRDRLGNVSRFMGASAVPYLMEISWMGRSARDIYLVDVTTGHRTLAIEKSQSTVAFSPDGNYIVFFEPETAAWMVYSVKDGQRRNLTSRINVNFYDEDNDVPQLASPYGIAGWGLNDAFVVVYDRYDLWQLDPAGKLPAVNLTRGAGRTAGIRLRYQNLDPENAFLPVDNWYLTAYNETTKQSGFYRYDIKTRNTSSIIMEDASFQSLQKAKNDNRFLWRKGSFAQFPDLYTSGSAFDNIRRITQANPWQSEYLWGSVQLVEWQDFSNRKLQGLLYLPENFDPGKKYPMIVYFYERTSDGLHRHWAPAPSRSTINASYCTSNGYIVFMPDIVYETGFPGRSAYNCIVSGTQAMVERYPFIDRNRVALQGQSWGGYQIAYLVTKTNMFRAAMAGAPVSNMVSAYGGIRWESGMVRQFQYEQSQSRIGGTLWEKPLHYIENSPVFFVPDINTPLLIMHNDNDGAVPWYQGIELFTAMRRLQKPVWMLVYNREAHNLREWPARMDLSVRMYQFFEHYLKDAPAPRWMQQGIPFIDKGKVDGYELME